MKITREYPAELIYFLTAQKTEIYNLSFDKPNVSIRLTRTATGHRTEIVVSHEWGEDELEAAIDERLAEDVRLSR